MGGDFLHEREWGMLLASAKGATREEIGRVYGVSASRVSALMRAVIGKLGARDVAHAFAVGLALGVFRLDDLHDLEVPATVQEAARDAGVVVPEETRAALNRGRRAWAETEERWQKERESTLKALRQGC
ncbi:LuxR C-terminal-related transcriptional regulator [Streptomyces sp. NPDC101175]|uniref:LuxR C-terminal-related transcriptional regulator n=1 Tax=Streptomyces sp. NPDC101175 TaxID=3366123 RepID=UPI003834771C